jgi:hypothetical protein
MAAKIDNKTELQVATVEPRPPRRVRAALRKTVLRPLPSSIFAAVGIFGGLSSLFVGLTCVVIHAMVTGDRVFDRAGTVLLVAAIPMILIGSVFLDEIQGNKC